MDKNIKIVRLNTVTEVQTPFHQFICVIFNEYYHFVYNLFYVIFSGYAGVIACVMKGQLWYS